MDPADIRIRPARPEDLTVIRALTPRLAAFGGLTTRDPEAVVASVTALLEDALERATAGGAPASPAGGERAGEGAVAGPVRPGVHVFIAESPTGEALGCVQVQVAMEFFSGEPEAYVGALMVSEAAEGRGVGRALMQTAEGWARERGLRRLSLEVFAGNARARAFYQKLGFEEDSLRLVREW